MKSFPKILTIVFLSVLFFQINALYAEDCAWILPTSFCSSFNLAPANRSLCSSVTTDILACQSDPYYCQCCCKTDTPTTPPPTPPPPPPASKTGIQFAPQVKIPGYEFKSDDKTTGNIANLVKAIYNYAIGIVGILAAVVLMIGGVLWIVAGGNTTQIGEAKAWIGAALTGLILALTSYLILNTVNPALVNLQVSQVPGVEKAPETTEGCCVDQNQSVFNRGYLTKDECEDPNSPRRGSWRKPCPKCQWGVGSWNEFYADTCNDIARARNWESINSWVLGTAGECAETKPAGNHVLCCCLR